MNEGTNISKDEMKVFVPFIKYPTSEANIYAGFVMWKYNIKFFILDTFI